jgi:hypothetical protein
MHVSVHLAFSTSRATTNALKARPKRAARTACPNSQ